ncbi:Hypothetical protein NTJ_10619 [Nesidiocoris tenuis]|uniref:Uncharacterized protein n=1 Tax=Nesidiocoris tenuis TaxID=355587 RepID=A0ABN7B058_9HEMI|nr:Hypothetical protein NTJ_10619 [Nesidiocoris tenuis]
MLTSTILTCIELEVVHLRKCTTKRDSKSHKRTARSAEALATGFHLPPPAERDFKNLCACQQNKLNAGQVSLSLDKPSLWLIQNSWVRLLGKMNFI